jgi:hypothetical protein
VVTVHDNVVSICTWGGVIVIINPNEFIYHTEYMRKGVVG